MGNKESQPVSPGFIYINEEKEFHKFFTDKETNMFVSHRYVLSPKIIKQLLMSNPEIFPNVSEVLRYLITFEENEQDLSLLQPLFKEYNLGKDISCIRGYNKTYAKQEIKKTEGRSPLMSCLESLFLRTFANSTIDTFDFSCIESIASTSNISPPISESLINVPSYHSLLSMNSINPRAMTSNGQFLFVFGGDSSVFTFPILENGSILSPISHSVKISDSGSASIYCDSLRLYIVSSKLYVYSIDTLLYSDSNQIVPKDELKTPNCQFLASDGVIRVHMNSNYQVFLYDFNSDKYFHTIQLCKGVAEVNPNVPELLQKTFLYEVPSVTNGTHLSFLIKISDTQALMREFSLVNGEHISDILFNTDSSILCLCLDIINRQYWVSSGNGGEIVIKSLQYYGSYDPLSFGLSLFAQTETKKNNDKVLFYVICKLRQIMISNVHNTTFNELFSLTEQDLISCISNSMALFNEIKNNSSNSLLYKEILKLYALIISNCISSIIEEKSSNPICIREKIQTLLISIVHGCLDTFSIEISSVFLIDHMDFLVTEALYPIIIAIVEFSSDSLLFPFLKSISMSKFLTFVPLDKENKFSKTILSGENIENIQPKILSLLFIQQRVIVRESAAELKNDMFSSVTLYESKRIPVTAIDFLSIYIQFIINEFTNRLGLIKSFEELEKTLIYHLLNNFLMLLWGMVDQHAIAKIILPLLSVLPQSLKLFFAKLNHDPFLKEESCEFINRIAFSFGLYSATLIKGGDYSDFENRNKWLIQANMDQEFLNNQAENPYMVTSHVLYNNFIHNGKEIINIVYRKWKPAINRNISNEISYYDRLSLSVMMLHLKMDQVLENLSSSSTINDELRPLLDQMSRIRNTIIQNLRSGVSNIMIENKCKLLLKMKTSFSIGDDIPKLISNFILSKDTPESIIHFITNQKIRVDLTSIGFPLVQALYQGSLDPKFYNIVSLALTTIKNFDNLSSLLQNEKQTNGHISEFLNLVASNRSPNLLLVAQQLIRSKVVKQSESSGFLRPFFNELISQHDNYRSFAICVNLSNSIEGLLEELMSQPNPQPIHLFFIADILRDMTKVNLSILSKCIQIVLHSKNSTIRYAVRALYFAFQKAIVHDEKLDIDLSYLLNYLGKCQITMKEPIIACELVTLFRQLLLSTTNVSFRLINVIKSITPENAKDNEIAAVFSILGGSLEIKRPYCHCSIFSNHSKYPNGILFGSKNDSLFFEDPFNFDTVPISASNYRVLPKPDVSFNPYMFPDFEYVLSFYFKCTKIISNSISVLFIRSLSSYIEVQEFACSINEDVFNDIMNRCVCYMSPFDTIHETVSTLTNIGHKSISKSHCGFEVLCSNDYPSKVFVSPIIKSSRVDVTVTSNVKYIGYIGIVTDSLKSNVSYQLLHIPSNTVYPSESQVRLQKIENSFSFSIIQRNLQIKDVCLKINDKKTPIRIVISPLQDNLDIGIVVKDFDKVFENDDAKIPLLGGMNRPFSSDTRLYDFPAWTKKSLSEVSVLLSNIQNLKPFPSLLPNDSEYYYKLPDPPKKMPLHPEDASSMSESLFISYSNHFFAKLFSQSITIVIMKLVKFGYAADIPPHFLIRLFSILSIQLECLNESELAKGNFPFSLQTSILSPHSVLNEFDSDYVESSHQAVRLIAQTNGFDMYLQRYIKNLMDTPHCHLLSDPSLSLLYFSKGTFNLSVNINAELFGATHMIVSIPEFNNCIGHSIRVNNTECSLPFIVSNNKLVFDLLNESYLNRPFSVMLINNNYNSWAFGTVFELILLIKHLYHLSSQNSGVLIRSIVLDLLMLQSPYSWPYIVKLIGYFCQDFVEQSSITGDYISRLVLLGSFINKYREKLNIQISSFFIQEQRTITSGLPYKLAPSFPEFISSKAQCKHATIAIPLPVLNFTPSKDEIHSLFVLYQNLVAERHSFDGYPFYEILPIWLSLSNYLSINDSSSIEVSRQENGLITIHRLSKSICTVMLETINIPIHSALVMYSNDVSFSSCEIIPADDLPKSVNISSSYLYIRLIDIPDVNNLDIKEINQSLVYPEGSTVQFNSSDIHDYFISDMDQFLFKWTPAQTRDLVLCFQERLFQQTDFELLKEGALKSPHIDMFSPKVVLLYTFFIHRFNYMWHHHKIKIPESINPCVMNFISPEDASKDFIHDIVNSNAGIPSIKINRRDAHRIVLDGSGDQSMTIIAQFTKQIKDLSIQKLQRKESPWSVSFKGEGAIDAGGPQRELFNEVSYSIFQQTSNLFILSPNGRYHCGSFRDVFVPFTNLGKTSYPQYIAIGTYLGVVIRTGLPQNLPFAPFIWNYLAGEAITERDILMIDDRLKTQINRLREAKNDSDFVSRFSITWSLESWSGSIVSLSSKHSETYVKGEEVEQYIVECVSERIKSITPYLTLIRRGFVENIGFESHPLMSSGLLSILAQGTNIITSAQLKQITSFTGFATNNDTAIKNYWIAVDRMTNEQRSKLLKFITSLTRLPNRESSQSFRITVYKASEPVDRNLPRSSTCFNKLYLPPYSTAEITFQKIVTAIELCDTMENM